MRIASVNRIDRSSSRRAIERMGRRAGDMIAPESAAVAAGAALVPAMSTQRESSMSSMLTRPDASFVAHLIATAEQSPQTRGLRRAAVADVDTVYRAANHNRSLVSTGVLTQRSA